MFYYAWEPSGKGGGRESCTRTRVLEYRGLLGGSSVPEVAIRGGWDGMGWGVSLLLWMDREGEYRGEVYFIFRVCMLVGLS